MAKTLEAYKKEFADLKKLVNETLTEVGELDNNMKHYQDMLNEGAKEVGLRIHALRDSGTTGTKIEDFMGDKELATFVKEMSNHKEMGKAAAMKAAALRTNHYKPVKARFKALQDGLTAEIAERKKKVTNKTLGLNQSAKDFDPLLADVDAYVKRDPHYMEIRNDPGSYTAAQFESQYTGLIAEELTKSKAAALSAQQSELLKQSLSERNMTINLNKAKSAAATLAKQVPLAQAAQKARDVPSLSKAKTTASTAMTNIKTLLEPYEKTWKDAKVLDAIKHSPDGPAVMKGLEEMRKLKDASEINLDDIESRRMV